MKKLLIIAVGILSGILFITSVDGMALLSVPVIFFVSCLMILVIFIIHMYRSFRQKYQKHKRIFIEELNDTKTTLRRMR